MTGQLDLFHDCAAPLGRAIEIDRDTPVPEPRRTQLTRSGKVTKADGRVQVGPGRVTQLTDLPGTEFEHIFAPPEAA